MRPGHRPIIAAVVADVAIEVAAATAAVDEVAEVVAAGVADVAGGSGNLDQASRFLCEVNLSAGLFGERSFHGNILQKILRQIVPFS